MVSHVWHSESFLLNSRQSDVELYRPTTSHMFYRPNTPDPKTSEHNKEQSKGNQWSHTKPQNIRVIKQCRIHEILSLYWGRGKVPWIVDRLLHISTEHFCFLPAVHFTMPVQSSRHSVHWTVISENHVITWLHRPNGYAGEKNYWQGGKSIDSRHFYLP